MHKTKNDLPEKTRTEVIAILNARLADSIDLMHQAKQAHWNIKGPSFIALHKLFDEIVKPPGGRGHGPDRGARRATGRYRGGHDSKRGQVLDAEGIPDEHFSGAGSRRGAPSPGQPSARACVTRLIRAMSRRQRHCRHLY